MDNTAVLTAGNAIYSQKRAKKRARVEELTFDPEGRKDFLTGFHKRKKERQKKAAEFIKEQTRKDKIEARKELRDARKADIEQRLQAVNANIEGSDVGEQTENEATDITVPKDSIWENHFEDNEKLTTVTIIEDFDQVGLETIDPKPQPPPPTTAEIKIKSHPDSKKKKAFRYGTKAERQSDRKKASLKKQSHSTNRRK